MNTRKTVHILSHTHWDREWYLDSKYTNEWLIVFFDNLLALMDREPAYKFILDGQTLILEDWFEQLEKSGRNVAENKRKIKTYVRRGRLTVGPYYVQTDWQLVSGESLARNLLIGHRLATGFGKSMEVGWLPDNFGQISQAPQIHAQCGLRGLYVWRGVYMKPNEVKTEFLWKSPDGTALPSVYLINSYRNAMRLAAMPAIAKKRVTDEIARMDCFNTTSHVLLMDGYDQDLEPDDVMPVLRRMNAEQNDFTVQQSTPEEYLDAVLAEKPDLPILEGTQYNGHYISVFPGVMSARIYLKQQNDMTQHMLERLIEPLSSFNFLFGGEYGETTIESLWKLMLKNQPHDSICGVGIDQVHADMESRHMLIRRGAGEYLQRVLSELCSRIDTSESGKKESLVVWNTSLRTRNAVVRYRNRYVSAGTLPSFGWKVIDPDAVADRETAWVREGSGEFRCISGNGLVEISIRHDGSFDLTDCSSGTVYEKLGVLEDSGDAGDLYSHAKPENDMIRRSTESPVEITVTCDSKTAVAFRISCSMHIPEGLSDDGKTRSGRMTEMPVVTHIRLETGSPIVKIDTYIRNTAKNHVLRALFPTNLKITRSYGGSPFDVTCHPLHTEALDENNLPARLRNIIIGAREPGSNGFFLGQNFADVSDGIHGLAVFNRGLPEYQVRENSGCIALTLFRGVGSITREVDNQTRIGDAGPGISTPDGQCLRDFHFAYGVYPHKGDAHDGMVAYAADDFAHPVLAAETLPHPGELRPEYSLLGIVEGQAMLSAFKKAETHDTIILRIFNPSKNPSAIVLRCGLPLSAAWRCDLLEHHLKNLPVGEGDKLCVDLSAKEIVTLDLDFGKREIPCGTLVQAEPVDETEEENFSAYPAVPAVSKAELYGELRQAALLAGRVGDAGCRRAALEAKLSAILMRSRFSEQEIRSLGLELNNARVQKRLQDYIASYDAHADSD